MTTNVEKPASHKYVVGYGSNAFSDSLDKIGLSFVPKIATNTFLKNFLLRLDWLEGQEVLLGTHKCLHQLREQKFQKDFLPNCIY